MMTAEPPQTPITEPIRSLEVRWIFPGQLEAAVAGWFGRTPAAPESREDTYLLDPQSRGQMGAWQKWSFPFSPPSPGSGDPAGWRPVLVAQKHAKGDVRGQWFCVCA